MKDETNNVYNRLTVISRASNTKKGDARWLCQCNCGNPNPIVVMGSALRNGHTKSCGCIHRETARGRGILNKKENIYDLSGEYGVGYTSSKQVAFYFDLEDYEKIKGYCWNLDFNGYVVCKREKVISLHRLVMGNPKGMLIDHINHIRTDNRKSELRVCTFSQNFMNQGASKYSTSGIRGVYWYSRCKKWSAEIRVNGENHRLGFFVDIEEAAKVRREAEQIYFKEFAYKGDD